MVTSKQEARMLATEIACETGIIKGVSLDLKATKEISDHIISASDYLPEKPETEKTLPFIREYVYNKLAALSVNSGIRVSPAVAKEVENFILNNVIPE